MVQLRTCSLIGGGGRDDVRSSPHWLIAARPGSWLAVASPGGGWWPGHMPVAQFRADPVTVHRWTERGESPSDQKLDHRLEHSYIGKINVEIIILMHQIMWTIPRSSRFLIPEQCEFQSDVNKLEQKKTFDKSLVEWPRSSFTCWTAHVQDERIYTRWTSSTITR